VPCRTRRQAERTRPGLRASLSARVAACLGGPGLGERSISASVLLLWINDHPQATTAGLSPFLFGAVLLLVVVFFPGGLDRLGEILGRQIRSVQAKRWGGSVGVENGAGDMTRSAAAESAGGGRALHKAGRQERLMDTGAVRVTRWTRRWAEYRHASP
jgi:hypothetical protein